MPRKYGPKAQEAVREARHKMKTGKLKSSSGQKVKNPKQAIAIGLSEARKKGAKVPAGPGNRGASPKGRGGKKAKQK